VYQQVIKLTLALSF